MSDSRDFVVRLAFQHGDTRSQIAAIRNEMRLLESGFRASDTGATGLSAALNRTAAQSSMLRQQIALQRQEVERYNQAIAQEQQKIAQLQQRQQQLPQQIENEKNKRAQLREELSRAQGALNAAQNAAERDEASIASLQAEVDRLNGAITESTGRISTWEGDLRRADGQIANADRRVQSMTIAQNEATASLTRMENQLRTQSTRLRAVSDEMRRFGEQTTETGRMQEEAGKKMSVASAAIVAAGTASVGAAIGWESAFADVQKTVSGTEEQLSGIEQQLLDMSEIKPVDSSVLAGIAANAGQLGIATDNVVAFTSTMADLTVTTNLTADTAAAQFAKFANITQMSQDNFDRLGSTVVVLGNNLATTEADVMAMGMSLAAAGSQVGMTEAEIMGMAGTLSSLGLEAQAGGTAFSKLFVNMQVAVETGSEQLQDFARVAGMTGAEFQQLFTEDAAGAVAAFVGGLSSGSESAIVMLDQMGISETRFRDALLRTSNAAGMMRSSIDMANSAWRQNNALASEAGVRYGTTESKLSMLANRTKNAAITFGKDLLPAVSSVVDWAGTMLEKFNSLDESQRKNILTWGAIIASIGPAIAIIGKANTMIGTMATRFAQLSAVSANAGGGVGGLFAAVKNLAGPAGMAALYVGLAIGIGLLIDWASGARDARKAAEEMSDAAKKMREETATTIYDTGNTDPLGSFGLTADDFRRSTRQTEGWFDSLVSVWTDGKAETNDIVNDFVSQFTGSTDNVRAAIEAQQTLLSELGLLTPEAQAKFDEDLAKLDAYDRQVEDTLKRRQNGKLTDGDIASLTGAQSGVAEIGIQYSAPDSSGYQRVLDGMQSEIARIEAMGGTAGAETFGNALNALAAGRKAYNDELTAGYDAQFAQVQLIEDETVRAQALIALNEQYNAQRTAGEEEYNAAVAQTAGQAFKEGDYGAQIDQFRELAALMGDSAGWKANLSDITETFTSIDEGGLTSAIALLEQMKAAGMSNEEIQNITGINVDELRGQLAQVKQVAGEMEVAGQEIGAGIQSMFSEALPEEIQRVLVGLDMTQAAEDWANFAEGKDPWGVSGSVSLDSVTDTAVQTWVTENAEISGVAVTLGAKYGDAWSDTVNGKVPTGLLKIYQDGMEIPVTPNALAQLTEKDFVATGDDGMMHVYMSPKVSGYAQVPVMLNPIDQAQIATWRRENENVNIVGPAARLPIKLGDNWQAQLQTAIDNGFVTIYGADGKELPITPEVLEKLKPTDIALVDEDGSMHIMVTAGLGTKEGLDKSLTDMNEDPLGAVGESVQEQIGWIEHLNGRLVETKNALDDIRELKKTDPSAMFNYDGMGTNELDYWDKLYSYQTMTLEKFEDLTVFDYETLAGRMSNVLSAVQSGALEGDALAAARQELQGYLDMFSAAESVGYDFVFSENLADSMIDYGWEGTAETLKSTILGTLAAGGSEDTTAGEAIAQSVEAGVEAHEWETMTAGMQEKIGEGLASADSGASEDAGENIAAGIETGMKGHAWSGAAGTVYSGIMNAMAVVYDMHSPARKMVPVGGNIAAGIAQGMSEFSFGADVATTMSNITSQFGGMRSKGSSIGSSFGEGLMSGLRSKMSQTVSLAKTYAKMIENAFKDGWRINSPSRVAADLTAGFGEGLEKGMEHWPKVSRRVLEDDIDLLHSGMNRAVGSVTNAQSYDQSSTVTVNVQQLRTGSDADVEQLAQEISQLVRNRQYAKGKR